MPNKILVTFASRTGTTAGVADAVASVLSENNPTLDVEVRAMKDVKDLTPYQAVVAGSAIQDGQWLPEAMQFVQTHQAALRQKPFAAFLVCMTLAMNNPQARDIVPSWLEPVRRLVRPVSEGFFAGRLDIQHIPSLRKRIMFRISVALGIWTEGDHRDWTAIHNWAMALPVQLLESKQATAS